ncbi:hypothetical protein A0H81_05007 [Grifola frondosa]|uniref:Uncharacterized protein n=1 Tax=Grifola frondosa TaxID=5627 RepID=A0A1C7ME93_GRIFR|nr:hypothetical protein A0H81_05007 [Grifola frondosa]
MSHIPKRCYYQLPPPEARVTVSGLKAFPKGIGCDGASIVPQPVLNVTPVYFYQLCIVDGPIYFNYRGYPMSLRRLAELPEEEIATTMLGPQDVVLADFDAISLRIVWPSKPRCLHYSEEIRLFSPYPRKEGPSFHHGHKRVELAKRVAEIFSDAFYTFDGREGLSEGSEWPLDLNNLYLLALENHRGFEFQAVLSYDRGE